MDEIEVAAVWLLHKRNAKRKVNRKMWVHPINNARLGNGAFHVLSEEIKSDSNFLITIECRQHHLKHTTEPRQNGRTHVIR